MLASEYRQFSKMNYLLILVLCPVFTLAGHKYPTGSHDSDAVDKTLGISVSSSSRKREGTGYAGHVEYSTNYDNDHVSEDHRRHSKHVDHGGHGGKQGEISGIYHYEVHGTRETSDGHPGYTIHGEGIGAGTITDTSAGHHDFGREEYSVHNEQTGSGKYSSTGGIHREFTVHGDSSGRTVGFGGRHSKRGGSSTGGHASAGEHSSGAHGEYYAHGVESGSGEYSSTGGGHREFAVHGDSSSHTVGSGGRYSKRGGVSGGLHSSAGEYSSGGHGEYTVHGQETGSGKYASTVGGHREFAVHGDSSSHTVGSGVRYSKRGRPSGGEYSTGGDYSGGGHHSEGGHLSSGQYSSGDAHYSHGSSYGVHAGYDSDHQGSSASIDNVYTSESSTRKSRSGRRTTEQTYTPEKTPSGRRITESATRPSEIVPFKGRTTEWYPEKHDYGHCKCNKEVKVAFEWNYFNFTWTCPLKMAQMRYSPVDYIPLSIAIYEHSVFMTFPRFRRNARITLARMPLASTRDNPSLTPYPTWEMNTGTQCDSLQDVTDIEVDRDGVMWILDGRRLHPDVKCPPKLVLLDLKRNGKVVKSYELPESICPKHGCLLNDMVVDGDFAFISDLTAGDEGIIVYHRRKNRCWKINAFGHGYGSHHGHHPGDCNPNLYRNDRYHSVAWIGLAPSCQARNRIFLYVPESLPHALGIDVNILKDERRASGDVSKYVHTVFSKSGTTGAVTYDSQGNIFLGLISKRTVGVKWHNQSHLEICPPRSDLVRYPGIFAFDNENGDIYMTEMASLTFASSGVDIRQNNFQVLKWHTGKKNYLYCTGKHY